LRRIDRASSQFTGARSLGTDWLGLAILADCTVWRLYGIGEVFFGYL